MPVEHTQLQINLAKQASFIVGKPVNPAANLGVRRTLEKYGLDILAAKIAALPTKSKVTVEALDEVAKAALDTLAICHVVAASQRSIS